MFKITLWNKFTKKKIKNKTKQNKNIKELAAIET